MKKFGAFAQDGFKGSIELMRFLKDSNDDLQSVIAAIVGNEPAIVSGMAITEDGGNTTITNGVLMYNGKLYSFTGGTYAGEPGDLKVVMREDTAPGYPDPFFVGDALPKKIYLQNSAMVAEPEEGDVSEDLVAFARIKDLVNLMKDSNDVGEVIMFHGNLNDFFNTSTGLGLPGKKYERYAICDGQNGTPDMRNRFVVGAGDEYSPGDVGGAKEVTLTKDNIPPHRHGTSFLYNGRPFNTPGRFDEISAAYDPAFGGNKQLNVNVVYTTGPGTGGSFYFWEMKVNTGNGTDNISNQDKLKASPDAVENRPPYIAMVYIKKII